ncbi:MAG TPA: hypothetical protein VG267_10995 [Terracidiphilus sp.]|jgi:hypothetical protein|nr:hypothetical protein [Terracidiphilus sp.]
MRQIGFTLTLFVLVLSPLAAVCQGLPDGPAPAESSGGTQSTSRPSESVPANPQISDRDWKKIQHIAYGEPIVVASTYGPPLQCRFASSTDAALFCDAAGSPDGTGFRFERATLLYVELTMPQPRPDHHPAWISSMIAGGILVGLCATATTSDGRAAADGAIGALIVGAIGAPLAYMNRDNGSPPGPVVYGRRALVSVPPGKLRPWKWRLPASR